MENIYKSLVENAVSEYIECCLDASVYNINELKGEISRIYLNDFSLNCFLDNIQENVDEILHKEFRIDI